MTPQEIQSWKQHPVTEAFIAVLDGRKRTLQDSWSAGQFTGNSTDETAQMNAKAIGQVQMLEDILQSIEDMGHE